MSKFRKWAVACSLAAVGAAVGATVLTLSGTGQFAALTGSTGGGSSAPPASAAATAMDARPSKQHIVVFREAPLASFKGGAGLAAPARIQSGPKRGRIDVRSAQARNYVRHLEGVQMGHEADLGRALGHSLEVRKRMQHAVNAIIADLSDVDAERIREMPEVAFVEEYREYEIETDVGPRLIGAEPVWNGTVPGTTGRFQGEGVVVGIIDSGINFGSPSFAAVDPIDGYQHANPRGAGNYLGTCAAGGVDEGRCNDKLIGGYDFVCGLAPDPSQPANTYCSLTSTYREEPGFGDTSSHGSHVASTVAGNRRDASYKGATVRIAGVAPRANIVAYDVCYTNVADGRGLCPNVASVQAVNQAVADGIVDVLNFSIGGGVDPWSDSVSMAFLNAVDAGIYVATSAGNSGPGPNTMGHHEPWTGSTAAAQHGRGDYGFLMDITGPGAVPSTLRGVVLNEGSGGTPFTASIPGTTPLRVSAGIDTTNDGCSAFAAGAFQGTVAVIRRGTCSFAIKANNAAAAGAVAIIVANNQAGVIAPSVPGTTIPAFGVQQATGNALRDFHTANGGATVSIPYPPVALANTPDQLAAFSSRGPADVYDLLKPDVTAPGVNVLAVVAGTTLTGFESAVGLMSGTSMASPHHAGAAALLRQAKPTWTVPEVKSALAMTAKQEVLLEDGVTPANAFARGAGRIQVDAAVRAGLVLHETKANYMAADPWSGGDPTSLNQPSLINSECFERCVFKRTFRNTLTHRQAWAVKMQGLSATVSPALFTVNPGESKTVTITVNAYQLPANGAFNFGTLVLTAQSAGNPNQPVLRLPVTVAVQPAAIEVAPNAINLALLAGGNGVANVAVSNTGGSRLNFAVDNTGAADSNVVNEPATLAGSGFRSTRYTDAGMNPPGQYAADDFTLTETTRLSQLTAEGFTVSGADLASMAANLTWSIFPDASGVPAGNPETSPGMAVWTYTAAPASAGVTTAAGTIGLNLLTAGQNVTLPPGRYWLVVNSRSSFANRWVWFASDSGDGTFMTIAPGATGTGVWTTPTGTAFRGLAWLVNAQVVCGASWIGSATPSSGQVAPGTSSNVQVQVSAASLAAGSYTGYACVSSNDARRPKVAVRIALTVTP